jgi:hypothetical protein
MIGSKFLVKQVMQGLTKKLKSKGIEKAACVFVIVDNSLDIESVLFNYQGKPLKTTWDEFEKIINS